MTTKAKVWLLAACVAVLLAVHFGPKVLPTIGVNPVTAAVIVEESKERSKINLEKPGVGLVLDLAPKHGVVVVDKDVLSPDKKPPVKLVPFLSAAKDKPLPGLVTRHGTDQYDVQPCPDSEAKLLEAIK